MAEMLMDIIDKNIKKNIVFYFDVEFGYVTMNE